MSIIDREWSKKVAALAVDALIDAELVKRAQFDEALELVAYEIEIRLCMGDKPKSADGY